MPLDEKLKEIDPVEEMDEKQFYQLVLCFRDDFLKSENVENKLSKHRKPLEFLSQVLQSSFDRLREIGNRKEMNDTQVIEGKVHSGYVYTLVRLIHEEDKSLNVYHSIKKYCRQTNKEFNTIAMHLAEYRGLEMARGRIRAYRNKLDKKIKVKSNADLTNLYDINLNNPFAASNMLILRSEIMNKFPSENLLSLLATQNSLAKMMSSHEFMIQAAQRQQFLSVQADAIAKLISTDTAVSRTIRSTIFLEKMFDFRPVPKTNLDHYLGLLRVISNNNFSGNKSNDLKGNDNSQLLEVEYELIQLTEDIKDTNEEQKRHIILLNESDKIKKIILDIYKNHKRLLDVDSRQFEELIAELLSNRGLKVELTKQTRDGGYDIIALHEIAGLGTQKWLVECKRFTKDKVGVDIIRSFKEVVQSSHVNRGIIATTSYFSADALKKQQETPYLLDFRDKDAVMEWIIDYGSKNLLV